MGDYYFELKYHGEYDENPLVMPYPLYRLEIVDRPCNEFKVNTPHCTNPLESKTGGFELTREHFESGDVVLRPACVGGDVYHLWFPKRHHCADGDG